MINERVNVVYLILYTLTVVLMFVFHRYLHHHGCGHAALSHEQCEISPRAGLRQGGFLREDEPLS